jgi:hypothetical protein
MQDAKNSRSEMQKMSIDVQEEKKKEQQQQQELIDWRRGQVIQLISKGKNLAQPSEIY